MSLKPSSPELARMRASARAMRERTNSIRACYGSAAGRRIGVFRPHTLQRAEGRRATAAFGTCTISLRLVLCSAVLAGESLLDPIVGSRGKSGEEPDVHPVPKARPVSGP